MAIPAGTSTTTISITLPSYLADKAEALAEQEGRTVSELFGNAFRDYQRAKFDLWWKELQDYAVTRNPHGYTEEDIPRLIKEVRAEMAVEEEARKTAKASRSPSSTRTLDICFGIQQAGQHSRPGAGKNLPP